MALEWNYDGPRLRETNDQTPPTFPKAPKASVQLERLLDLQARAEKAREELNYYEALIVHHKESLFKSVTQPCFVRSYAGVYLIADNNINKIEEVE